MNGDDIHGAFGGMLDMLDELTFDYGPTYVRSLSPDFGSPSALMPRPRRKLKKKTTAQGRSLSDVVLGSQHPDTSSDNDAHPLVQQPQVLVQYCNPFHESQPNGKGPFD